MKSSNAIIMLRTSIRVNLHSIVVRISRNSGTATQKQAPYLKFKWQNGIRTHNHLAHKLTLNYLAKLAEMAECSFMN